MKVKKIAIVGGGITGLAAAYFLSEKFREENLPAEIKVFEESSRFGGVIQTEKTGEGFLLEHGPDSFATDKPQAVDLCRRLGLEEEMIGIAPDFRRLLLRDRDKLFFLPPDFYLIAPKHARTLLEMPFLSPFGKIRMAMEILIPPKKTKGDESVGSFIERRFGREALRKIVQPMIGSIFSCDLYELSLNSTFSRFRELESNSGSVIRGLGKKNKNPQSQARNSISKYGLFVTLRSGLGTLVESLISQTRAQWFPCKGVKDIFPGKPWKLKLTGGETMEADYVCLAHPAFCAGKLFNLSRPGMGAFLARQPAKSMLLWNTVYRREDLCFLPQASGFVGEADSEIKIQGASFASLKFEGRAPKDFVLLRIFAGRQWLGTLGEMKESVAAAILHEETRKILRAKARPVFSRLSRHINMMPHYPVGHEEWLHEVQEQASKLPGLFLAGNSYAGGGIPDCIRTAEEAARKIFETVKANTEKQALLL